MKQFYVMGNSLKNSLPQTRSGKIVLLFIVLVGFFTRFWHLESLPFPPNGDELAFGYYGWSLANFASDEFGTKFPLFFPSIGDFKYPGLAYLNLLPGIVFGLTEISSRFISALSGVLLIPLVYILAYIVFQKRLTSIISALIVSLSPWAIAESRLGFENIPALTFTLGALLILLIVFESKKKIYQRNRYLFISLVLFISATFIYAAERIFIPLFLLSLILIYKFFKKGSIATTKILLVFLVTVSLIVGVSLLSPWSRGRAGENMWKGPSSEQIKRMEEIYIQAGISPIKVPPRVTWLLHNKLSISVVDFARRYLDHFSPDYLFFEGEVTLEKIPDSGLLLYAEIIFLPIGIIFLFNQKNKESHKSLIVMSWLLLAPLASTLTEGGAHMHRSSLMIPSLALISSFGANAIIEFFKKISGKFITLAVFASLVVSGLYGFNQLLVHKSVDKPWYKEQVFKWVSIDTWEMRKNYKAVVVGDDDYIFYLFYNKITPSEFLSMSDISPLTLTNRWERVDRVDNIYFKMPFNCPRGGKLGVLYVCAGGEVPQNATIKKVYYYLDKVPAFSLIEFYPLSKLPSPLPKLPDNLHYMVEVEKSPQYPDGIIPDSFESYW